MLAGKTLEQRYVVVRQIGKGSFCAVYQARDLTTLKLVAVKVLKPGNPDAEFKREIATLSALRNAVGVPKYFSSGLEGLQQYIVMELLERDVFRIVTERKRLSIGLVLQIAHDTLRALESIHQCGFLHLDVKPDNIAVRKKKAAYQCYFVDFGLACRYMIHGIHYSYCEEGSIRGNPTFASRGMLLGVRPSRRDDLESLMYTLAYIGNGSLPWSAACKSTSGSRHAIIESKDCLSSAAICGRLPAAMVQILTLVKQLRFDEKPDYARYLGLVEQAAEENGVDLREMGEWEKVLAGPKVESSASTLPQVLFSTKDHLQASNAGDQAAETPSPAANRRRAKRRLTKHIEQLDITPRRTNRSNVVICNEELPLVQSDDSQMTIQTAFQGRKSRGKEGTVKTDVAVTPKLRSNLAMWRNLADTKEGLS